jgi:hypothetical protein
LSKSDVIGRREIASNESEYQSLGSSLNDFATKRACLFNDKEEAGPKAWALFNFLQRIALRGEPSHYSGDKGPLAKIAKVMYERASSAEKLSIEWIERCLKHQVVRHELGQIKDLEGLRHLARLPTFLLEVLLRDGDPAPYSLFFYPISFEKTAESDSGVLLPTAFLAGTFGAVEWSCFPSVVERQNLHLFSVLDAVHPLVNHELGHVLAKDQKKFRDQIRAVDQARVAAAVVPAARGLVELFRQARGHIARIEAAANPDWGGLFGEMTSVNFARLFESSNDVPILRRRGEEPVKVGTSHAPSRATSAKEKHWSLLDQILVYLARDILDYKEDDLWSSEKKRIVRATQRPQDSAASPSREASLPFANQLFFDALHEIVAERNAKVEPADLLLLMKLLTVDAADPDRGVHIVQVAAALGTLNEANCKVSVALNGGKPVPGNTFCPRDHDGIIELAKIIAVLVPTALQGAIGTRDLAGWVQLPEKQERFTTLQVLRALAVLASDALNRNREGWVKVQSWEVEQLDARGFDVKLICDNWFPPKVKLALTEEHATPGAYHDLRTNLASLSRALSAPPSFVRLPSNTPHFPDDDNRFIISEWTDDGVKKKSVIALRFLS